MAQGNRGFADQLANARAATGAVPRPPPRTGILSARDNRLAELATGTAVTRLHEFVDPARCRIWDGHNRNYAALNETNCADLIESMRAQGRQEVPAIVRRVTGDHQHEFEVVCGARRHWTVTWLRGHNYPEFKFLIEPRELTDEEGFRLADLENRSRKDLSDYERATDYVRAIERYYDGSQQRMVERLEVSKSWLSRYLELARLPAEIIASFGSPQIIRITHAAVLAPLLRVPKTRERVLAAAAALAEEQAAGAELKPAVVVRRLSEAAADRARGVRRPTREIAVHGLDGAVIASGHRGRSGSVAISIPRASARNRSHVMQGLADLLNQLLGEVPAA